LIRTFLRDSTCPYGRQVAVESSDLLVLGAGPAGLAAAWRAATAGLSVTVLERAADPGGMAGSFTVDGVRVDHGSHRLHPATAPRLLADLRGLLGEDLQTRHRNGRLRVYGRWVGFPLRAGELAGAIPLAAVAGIGCDTVCRPLRRGTGDSYGAVLTRSLGPELYRALYAPYAVKLWGLAGSEIDPEQARVRVSADTPWKLASRIVRGRGDGQGRVFHYPRRGFGQLVEAMASAAVQLGVDLRTSTAVHTLRTDGDPAIAATAGGVEHRASRVFSTVPLPVLARLVTPAPPAAALASAEALRFRAMVLVYLVHQGGRWTTYDAHYLPGPETPVTRISEPANYRDSRSDPADRSVLCAEIPCSVGDAVWSADDATLRGLVTDGLAAVGLPTVRSGGVVVRRLPHVYPVYARGFDGALAGLEAWADALPTVTTFGRAGLFAHDNTHHAMAMAYAAVDALRPGGGWDGAAWAASRERFRAHVVED